MLMHVVKWLDFHQTEEIVINTLVAQQTNKSCEDGGLIVETWCQRCRLLSAIAEYAVTIINNQITFDQPASPPTIVALANNTESIAALDNSQINGTLSGVVAAANAVWQGSFVTQPGTTLPADIASTDNIEVSWTPSPFLLGHMPQPGLGEYSSDAICYPTFAVR
jgi:hypothetical protein